MTSAQRCLRHERLKPSDHKLYGIVTCMMMGSGPWSATASLLWHEHCVAVYESLGFPAHLEAYS